MDYLSLIGRSEALFSPDISSYEEELRTAIGRSRFLVIGAAGSIGQAVSREIFKRDPKLLHVVDISENSELKNFTEKLIAKIPNILNFETYKQENTVKAKQRERIDL